MTLAPLIAALALAGAPHVDTMVVGRTTVLQRTVTVRARATHVRVGRHRCAVAAATPLAALAAVRSAGGPSFSLRDYASCSRRARDAGGLYVRRIGPDRARGRAGWVYKVGRRLGTGPAADLAGPFGRGRLRSGQQVLWFWCRDASGCQRTLAVVPQARRVAPGAVLRVRVRGYDDAGHGRAITGATVALGGASATTGAGGVAELTAPGSPGTFALTAERAGLVPAFPEEVVIG